MDKWDLELGFAEIPFSILPDGNLDKLMEGAWLELYTLPELLKGFCFIFLILIRQEFWSSVYFLRSFYLKGGNNSIII